MRTAESSGRIVPWGSWLARAVRSGAVIVIAALLAVLSGCGGSRGMDGGDGPDRLHIVCTTGMVADLARNVAGVGTEPSAGDRIRVTQLMGEGVDPHTYKTSPGDVRLLSQADLILYSGHHLEGKMGETLGRMASRTPTVAVAESLPEERLISVGGDLYDPHLWFDVALWSECVDVVADAIAGLDPDEALTYSGNAAAYRDRLLELDATCRDRLASIPGEHRILITSHDAFSYFGRAYDVRVEGIQGISTESEAGIKRINDLVDLIVERELPAVFVETSVSEKNMKALLEGCRSRGHPVEIGGALFSDAMGRPGTPEGTYEGMVRSNVDTIVEGLRDAR